MRRLNLSTLSRRRSLAAAAAAGVALMAVGGSVPVWAGSDDNSGKVSVTDTETVQIYTDADGKVSAKRLYEQLMLEGKGHVSFDNPAASSGLRNLVGWGGLKVRDGEQHVSTDVDGQKALRSLSSYRGKLPLDVKVAYKLDGKSVKAADIVGKTGHLEVSYTVKNISGTQTQVSYPDGKGGTVSKSVVVPIPMVGSLSLTAPSTFRNVTSGQANLAGDGHGGTLVSFTMTLLPPIGSDTAEFGYSADITDGIAPRAEISALPVDPLASPTFKSAADSYQGGADTGTQLVAGATQIDDNLLKLRDGAADLLSGLVQLQDGAEQLSDGLGDAAPGANKLADGIKDAHDGSRKLADGGKQLADGLGDADSGAKKLKTGASDLNDGQRGLAEGLKKLHAGVAALPQSLQEQLADNPQFGQLTGALSSMIGQIGTASSPASTTTLLGAIKLLKYGVQMPSGAADCTPSGAAAGKCGVLDGIDAVVAGIQSNTTLAATINGAMSTTANAICPTHASPQACAGAFSSLGTQLLAGINASVGDIVTNLQAIKAGATAPGKLTDGFALLSGKISSGTNPATCAAEKTCGLLEGLQAIAGNIPTLVQGIASSVSTTLNANIGDGAKGCKTDETLQCGANALLAGTDQLVDGTTQLVGGTTKLRAGGRQLSSGAGDLVDGLGQLEDGSATLADGLGDAKTGSDKLAAGLTEAKDGAPQLVDGAKQLSEQGTQELIKAGVDTTTSYGEMVAVIKAGSERAQKESMVYGAPEGATGLAAYSYVLQAETGEGTRAWQRGGLAAVILALGAGSLLVRRRLLK